MNQQIIDAGTLIPIGVGVTVVASLVIAAWKLRGYWEDMTADMRHSNDKLSNSIQGLQVEVSRLNERLGGNVTHHQMRVHLAELRAANPSVKVPEFPHD